MTLPPFAHLLMRKGERALASARMELQHGDPDGAVNRAYYAMFNAARASILSAGISEGDLPRTHHGVIAAFGEHAVKSGRVDRSLGRSLNKAHALRQKADYTGLEIDAEGAGEIVSRAEAFVGVVKHEFGLGAFEKDNDIRRDDNAASSHGPSAEQIRREAREDWLRHRGTSNAQDAQSSGRMQFPKDAGLDDESE